MKKADQRKEQILAEKRERKRLNRIRRRKVYLNDFITINKEQQFRITADQKIIDLFKSNLLSFLKDNDFFIEIKQTKAEVQFPKQFVLKNNYSETIKYINQTVNAILSNLGKEISLDFSVCTDVDQAALFVLQIITYEIKSDLHDLNKKLKALSVDIKINIIESQEKKVNLHLLLCGFINNAKLSKEVQPIDTLGFLKGSKTQKHYLENKKGVFATKIVNYIDKCLMRNSLALTSVGKGDIGNMIGEILNNAEDHSPLQTYYISANYYLEKDVTDHQNTYGVLSLSFLNFGYSYYEGLESNKNENIEMYEKLDNLYKSNKWGGFTRENLFTLYALQEGVSRLKFEDESRGTGTITFINCFYSIGDFESPNQKIRPQLSLISGNTQITCKNGYKPYVENNRFYISLNQENSLSAPPDSRFLKDLKVKFPGTLLNVQFCLNENHLKEKLKNNENKP